MIRRRTDDTSQPLLEIVDPGLQTTVQDHPGRLGRQSLGFFPSGPVDHLSFRAANMLVGNRLGAAALEIPLGRFQAGVLQPTTVAVTGPEAKVCVNGQPLPLWESVQVREGDIISSSVIRGPGYRLYLAVAGGIEVPDAFGSRATHLVAGTGGFEGRALERADVLEGLTDAGTPPRRRLPPALRPTYESDWEVEVVMGPHADPDFLTSEDVRYFLTSTWRCDLNSDRVAIRLNPHRFHWARKSGDVAGGHPSNILDNSYPVGGLLAYGDVLTILGPDSNSSGGFAVIATIATAALWKVGQFRPGRDSIRFREVEPAQAAALDEHVKHILDPRHLDRS